MDTVEEPDSRERWQFWIDVGGTFTDCFARSPSGDEKHLKILSSGLTKTGGHVVDHSMIRLTGSAFDEIPDHFFVGSTVGLTGEPESRGYTVDGFQSNPAVMRILNLPSHWGEHVELEIDSRVPAPILAAHRLTRVPLRSSLPECDFYLGTTRGTNALLTRTGSSVALVTSQGFKDLLEIGDQSRPRLFDLTIRKPETLYQESIQINERVLFDGTVEVSPDPVEVKARLAELRQQGIESLAICLMHAYRYPAHERIVADIAADLGFVDIRISSEIASLIKIVPRAQTTVLDAYLNPVIYRYLQEIQNHLGSGSRLQLMTSAGSLSSIGRFSGKDCVLSGPAAGVVGFARIAQQMGFQKSIGFDMGGTSTDVSRFDGEIELEYESRKAGVTLMTPVVSIETVAAGGGSICKFDGSRLVVGPGSAGADPGPACYGCGGPLTVTDVNCYLGRIDRGKFTFNLDMEAVEDRLKQVQSDMLQAGLAKTLSNIAQGILRIANHNMALAIRNVSVKKGYDPRSYPLVSFGGAAGQHCCAVADELNIKKILIHPYCSILSAFGIQFSDTSVTEAKSILDVLDTSSLTRIYDWFGSSIKVLASKLGRNGETSLSLELRYAGTQSGIEIKIPANSSTKECREGFEKLHQQRFGYVQPGRTIEIYSARTTVTAVGKRLEEVPRVGELNELASEKFMRVQSDDGELEYGWHSWEVMQPGDRVDGPAVISSTTTTVLVDSGWKAVVAFGKLLELTRLDAATREADQNCDFEKVDPVKLEIFNRSFQSIAEQMGDALRQTSVSVNVKERLDYSCALFCENGELVANAPHIPVHLGAMSESVRSTIAQNQEINPGDVFVTNDPFQGGSHLPDVTVITPVFVDSNRPAFWVASRSHHAEIGGISPGSMPTAAVCLEQEGVLIQNLKLVDAGQNNFEELRRILTESKFPSRNPAENLDDVKAQVAANQTGVSAILALRERFGWPQTHAYMLHVRAAAETRARQLIRQLRGDFFTFEDQMDDGTRIAVQIQRTGDQLEVDFAGTSDVHSGNLNANGSIVRSAAMYVLRSLVAEDIPLNEGLLNPVNIRLPRCFLNPEAGDSAATTPAVVGGNVETSQRIVDVLLGAIGCAAASQGTMNNWLVGDPSFGYYETVGGGSGATQDGPGADAVHCHMSNTRLTDPEVLECRLPVVLRDFSIRRGSGGVGFFKGGNGMVRRLQFLAPLTLSLLTSRRTTSPFGMQGGLAGSPGENLLFRADGTREILPSSCQREVLPGDVLELRTPGGGGYGEG